MGRFDLSDFEWSVIEPLLPTKVRGVALVDDRRELNGIFWRLRTGATGAPAALIQAPAVTAPTPAPALAPTPLPAPATQPPALLPQAPPGQPSASPVAPPQAAALPGPTPFNPAAEQPSWFPQFEFPQFPRLGGEPTGAAVIQQATPNIEAQRPARRSAHPLSELIPNLPPITLPNLLPAAPSDAPPDDRPLRKGQTRVRL